MVETQVGNHRTKAANCSAPGREVLENLLAASACFAVQETNCSFNYYNSITGKFFITTMRSADPKQCFHCITVISFTKSVFSRLTSIVRYGNFTQYPEYEVAVLSCWSMLIFFIILFIAKMIHHKYSLPYSHKLRICCQTLILTSPVPEVSASPLSTSEELTVLS